MLHTDTEELGIMSVQAHDKYGQWPKTISVQQLAGIMCDFGHCCMTGNNLGNCTTNMQLASLVDL